MRVALKMTPMRNMKRSMVSLSGLSIVLVLSGLVRHRSVPRKLRGAHLRVSPIPGRSSSERGARIAREVLARAALSRVHDRIDELTGVAPFRGERTRALLRRD